MTKRIEVYCAHVTPAVARACPVLRLPEMVLAVCSLEREERSEQGGGVETEVEVSVAA